MTNERELTCCGPKTLQDQVQIGMVLVDADGRSWRVLSVEPLGRPAFSLRSLRLFAPKLVQVEHEFAPGPRISLDDVKARICESLDAYPLYWCEPSEMPEGLEERKAEVRSVESIREIHDKLGLDYFAE
jgi:hypothetical protein